MYELQPLKEVIDLLERTRVHAKKSMKGSHIKFEKNGRTVVVPNHGKKGIEKGTFYSI